MLTVEEEVAVMFRYLLAALAAVVLLTPSLIPDMGPPR